MSKRRKTSDPRRLRGSVVGPGGPHDKDGMIVDTSNAILLDQHTVAIAHTSIGDVASLLLGGRINHTQDRADVLFLMGGDGLAALVTEIHSLVYRASVDGAAAQALASEFLISYAARTQAMIREGLLPPNPA